MKNENIKKGVFFALITSIISGVAIFYSKIALAKIPPLVLTASRNSYVGLFFLFYALFFGKMKELKKLTKKDGFYLLTIGLAGGGIAFYLFFTGLQLTSATTANMIHKTLFIWVAVMAYFFLNERFNFSYLVGFLLIFIASFLISGLKLGFGRGESMIFLATLLWAGENIIAKKILKTVSSETVGLFRMAIGGLTLLLIAVFTGKGNAFLTIDNRQLTIIIVSGSILFGYVYFWYKALKFAPASLVSLILTFSVVVGNVLNGSFAGVKLLPKDFFSAVLITSAVFILLLINLKTQIIEVKSKC